MRVSTSLRWLALRRSIAVALAGAAAAGAGAGVAVAICAGGGAEGAMAGGAFWPITSANPRRTIPGARRARPFRDIRPSMMAASVIPHSCDLARAQRSGRSTRLLVFDDIVGLKPPW